MVSEPHYTKLCAESRFSNKAAENHLKQAEAITAQPLLGTADVQSDQKALITTEGKEVFQEGQLLHLLLFVVRLLLLWKLLP